MKILLATGNLGKLAELQTLFEKANFDNVELITLNDLEKVEEPVEDGKTFLANAYLKVMYYYNHFHLPTISDDTGLLVKALNNAPGVLTARYGSINGEHTDPVKNYMRILKELEGVTERSAKFSTAMYFYDGKELISSVGDLEGEIALKPSGSKGFGYAPIFYLPNYGKTLAEIDDDLKLSINHRGNAARLLIKQLETYLK